MNQGFRLLPIGLLLVAACSASGDDAAAPAPEKPVVAEVKSDLASAYRQCNAWGTSVFQVFPRHDQQGNVLRDGAGNPVYWKGYMPLDPALSDNQKAYESDFWSIPRANGYLYKVKEIACAPQGACQLDSRSFFMIGIRDSRASPPYLMAPPSGSAPTGSDVVFPTGTDWSREEAIDSMYQDPGRYPDVVSDSFACVSVVAADANGNLVPIDYFVLAGTHDPSGQPW